MWTTLLYVMNLLFILESLEIALFFQLDHMSVLKMCSAPDYKYSKDIPLAVLWKRRN